MLLILSHVMAREDGSWKNGWVDVLRDDSRKSILYRLTMMHGDIESFSGD